MSEILQGTLGEFVTQIIGGGTPAREIAEYWTGKIPWISVKDLTSSNPESTAERISEHGLSSSASRLIPSGIPIVATRMAVGRTAIFPSDVAINQDLKAIFPNEELLHRKYLFHFLKANEETLASKGTGSTVKGIRLEDLEQLPICVPSLPEQKKIAEILSGIDHSLAKLSDKINALTRLRVQLTRQFLTNEDHLQSNQESILPLDWQVKTLDEVAQFRRGSFPQPYGNPEWFDDNGFPFVQVFDIDDNGKLKSSTKSRISKAGAEKSVFIPCGSLIVSLQGSIGRVAITQYDAYVDRTILIFTDYQKDLDRAYFSLLVGDLFSRQGEVADGGVIKTITKQTLKDFSIKVPPLNEQKRMSKVVFALDRHISLYKKKLLKGNFLKQSLMGDLLSGRKRVST